MNKNNGINIREEVDKLFDSPPPSWPTDSTPSHEYKPVPSNQNYPGVVVAQAGVPVVLSSNSVHDWFELSYAKYLTVPRSVLQSMPEEWQERFVKCLEELDEAIDWRPEKGRYWVQLRDENGRFVPDKFKTYRHSSPVNPI